MSSITLRASVPASFAIVLLVAACGGGNDDPIPRATSRQVSESATSVPTEPPAATSTPAPIYNEGDVAELTQTQVVERDLFPPRTRFVTCFGKSYHGQNQTWIVECRYSESEREPIDSFLDPDATNTFVFDEKTGLIR